MKIKEIWRSLGKTEKVSIAMLLLLLFTLPLAVIVALRPVLFKPRAAIPITPPMTTYPIPTSLCEKGVDSFSVSDYCGQSSFRYMMFECLDHYAESSGSNSRDDYSCKKVDDWFSYAEEKCMARSCPTQTCLPRPACLDEDPPCDLRLPQHALWCPPAPTKSPGPTRPPKCPLMPIPEGCEEVQVQCVKEPCCPIIVCPGSPMPTPSATPPPPEYNQAPVITTESLNSAVVDGSYKMNVDGYDDDSSNTLIMMIDGLPSGLSKTSCNSRRAVSGRNWLVCTIEGKPQKAGTYRVDVTLFDGGGSSDQRHLSLVVKEVPRTFYERVFNWFSGF